MIQAVLFGLFETLVTRYSTATNIGRRIGIHEILSLDVDLVRNYFNGTQKARYEGKSWTRRRIIKQLAATHRVQIDRPMLRKYREQLHARKSGPFRSIDPDVESLLRRLRDSKIRTCILANCDYLDERYFLSSGLPALTDAAVSSCEVGVAKPDIGIYEKATKLIGVEAHDCLYVGAGLSGELQGAEMAGMRVYQAYWFIDRLDRSNKKREVHPFLQLKHPMNTLIHIGR